MIPPAGRNEMTKTRNELIGKVDREVGARFDWGSAMGMDEMDDGEFIRFEDHELIIESALLDLCSRKYSIDSSIGVIDRAAAAAYKALQDSGYCCGSVEFNDLPEEERYAMQMVASAVTAEYKAEKK